MNSGKLIERITLIANIGVVIGLGILIYEVNLSTKLAVVGAHTGRLSQMEQAHTEFAISDYLPRISVKLQSDGIDSLTPEEFERFRYWESSVKLRMASQYFQYQQGLLDQESADNILASAAARYKLWQELDVISIPGDFESAVELAVKK